MLCRNAAFVWLLDKLTAQVHVSGGMTCSTYTIARFLLLLMGIIFNLENQIAGFGVNLTVAL